jgi:hypothetical protein
MKIWTDYSTFYLCLSSHTFFLTDFCVPTFYETLLFSFEKKSFFYRSHMTAVHNSTPFATVSTSRTGARLENTIRAFSWIQKRPESKPDTFLPQQPLQPSPTIRFVSLLQEAYRKELQRLDDVQRFIETNPHTFNVSDISAKLNLRRGAIVSSYRNLIVDAKMKLQARLSSPLDEQHKLASTGIACIATFLPWTHTISSSTISVAFDRSQLSFQLRIDQDALIQEPIHIQHSVALIQEPIQIQRSVACCPAKNKSVEQLLKERCRRTLSTHTTHTSS